MTSQWSTKMTKVLDHIEAQSGTLRDERSLVLAGKSTLPRSLRDFVIEQFKD